MTFKYGLEFSVDTVKAKIDYLINQIFKLLPTREEGEEWMSPLENLILEITGMKFLWVDEPRLFSLLAKLECLMSLEEEDEFIYYRKLIFESLSLLTEIKNQL